MKLIKLLVILLISSSVGAVMPVKDRDDRIKVLGGNIVLDGFGETTQAHRFDKQAIFVGISTPTTPSTNHANMWLNNTTKQICTNFDDATAGCFTPTGSLSGYLTTSSATATYLQLSSATATYLQNSSATLTYLTKSSATVNYCHADGINCTSSGITSGSTTTWTGTNVFAGSTSIKGTATTDNAAPGYYGEYVSTISVNNVNAAATTVFDDLLNISLTAGDWDVSGCIYTDRNGATWSVVWIFFGTTAGNNTTGSVVGDNSNYNEWANSSSTPAFFMTCIPSVRMTFSSTTTVYLKRYFAYSAGTPRSAGGRISARRAR